MPESAYTNIDPSWRLVSAAVRYTEQLANVDRAMAFALEAGESWVAQGAYLYRVQRDFEGALAAYREAQKRLPNSALVFEYLGFVQRRRSRDSGLG